MSHPTTVWHALWNALRSLYRDLRRIVASSTEHGGQALVVDASREAVTAALGRRYFGPNWQFSYHERGEDLNLARVVHEPREVHGHEYVWWQTHVRGWVQDDGSVRLRPHYELEPTEYDQDHLEGIGLDVTRGVERLGDSLDADGLRYERYEDLPAGGER
ncbi:hypothetical protein [Natronomonas amylolytica]|uniref:hypothetical protein n=1 Tax=Natronomonas amylolytica TaxID=3108498 RepID=UPI00300B6F91